MKIALIGKNGMLGKDLVTALSEHEIIAPGHADLDITDEKAIYDFFNEHKVDAIFNAAALSNVDYCEEHEDEANALNGYAPGYLAKAAAKQVIPYIHYSTDYVFKGDNKDGYNEDDTPDPQNVYASSKLIGEQQAQEHNKRTYIARVCWLFGKGRSNFVDFVADAENCKIIVDQWGHPCYTKDLAEQSKLFLEDRPYGIYHVCNEDIASRYEQAAYIYEVLGKENNIEKVELASFPWKAHRPQYSIINNTKLPKLRSWKDAIRDYLKA